MSELTPSTFTLLTKYLASDGRYAPPPSHESSLVWLAKKDYIEEGFSPEIQALTSALVDRARSLLRETEQPTDRIDDLLQEAMWRVAVKFYSQAAWDHAEQHIYIHLSPSVLTVLARIELEMLQRMGWRLPFDEAARRIPGILEDHIRLIDWHLPTASQFAMTERIRFHAARGGGVADERTLAAMEQTAVLAAQHHQWLVNTRALRVHELANVRAAEEGLPVLGRLQTSADLQEQLDPAAPVRMLRKRPRGMEPEPKPVVA